MGEKYSFFLSVELELDWRVYKREGEEEGGGGEKDRQIILPECFAEWVANKMCLNCVQCV